MQILHSLLWGVATPGKLGSSYSQAFMFFHFLFVHVHFFCYLYFMTLLSCLIKYYHIRFINIVPPQGTVDGVQVQIRQSIHPLFRDIATPGEDRPELQFRHFGLHFFVLALLLNMFTHLFLSSFLSLPYFIVAVPMRKCLGKHSCTCSFPIVILNDT